MFELHNESLTLNIEPKGSVFSLASRSDPNVEILNVFPAIEFVRTSKNHYLPEEPENDFAIRMDEIKESKHWKLQIAEFTRGFQSQNVKLTITFALPEKYPMLLWKMEFTNLCCDPILFKKFHLLQMDKSRKSSIQFGLDEKTSRLAFYSNGWQSWSFTAAYGAEEKMRQSKLECIQGQQWHNAGTPLPKKRGIFSSDFYGVVGDRDSRKGWLIGFLSQKKQFGSVFADLRKDARVQLWANGDDAVVEPQGNIETDWAVLTPIEIDQQNPLDVFLDAAVRENDVVLEKRKPTGWCSWYEFYTKIDDQKISDNLDAVKQLSEELPMNLFQIDDGYETQIGDWLTCKPTFTNGMKPHADDARAAGLTAGLWQAPLIVHKRSKLAKEHPDWILRKKGRPVNSGFNWNSFTTAMDMTNPEAAAYVEKVVKTASKDWGYEYLKLDFLYAGGLKGDHKQTGMTGAQALRGSMQTIRDAVGRETFLLGCGAPLGSVLGLVDAMRIGEDVLDSWKPNLFGERVILRNEPNVPAVRNAIQNTLSRAMLHNKWWINDPDTLLIRQNLHLTLAEVQSLASIITLSGGMLMLSDNLPNVSKDRLRIAQQLIPQMDQRPWVLDWFDRVMPGKLRLDFQGETGKWFVISISNWEDKAKDLDLDLSEFHLPKADFWVRSFWEQKMLEVKDQGMIHLNEVPAHDTVVLAVREKDPGKAAYLGSDIHISQGLEISEWKDRGNRLEIGFDAGKVMEGQIELYLPRKPIRITFDGINLAIPDTKDNCYLLPVAIHKSAKMLIGF